MDKLTEVTKACNITDQAFKDILKKVKIGISEKGLAREVKKIFIKHNAKPAFSIIVAYGKNASEIHHKPTNLKLNKNHGFVLFDIGAKVNGYCADISRTVFFGSASAEQKKIYKTVLEAQRKAIEFIKSNCKVYDIDKIARDYIVKKGFDPIPHSLGHGVGKRVHENPKISPISSAILKEGAIFTIEPGIYIKGFGGVRIEDVLVLEKDKPRLLTHSPKTLIEL